MALLFGNLDAAIAKAEGYGPAGNIPTLANNPGDLVAGPYASAHGATGAITAANGQQIATFPDPATGFAAEDALIANNYSGGSITDLASSWLSGSSQQDQSSWANNVAGALGVPASTPVASLSGAAPSGAPASQATTGSGGGPFTALDNLAMKLDQLFGVQYPGEPTAGSGQAGNAFSVGRVAAFFVGLIFLAGGIFAFKPAQDVIVNTGKAAAKGAAVAAV
jgi:hypothetical protein